MLENMNAVIAEIDAEIDRLQRAKALLLDIGAIGAAKKRGRPTQKNAAAKAAPLKRSGRKPMSPEAKKRIGDAQRKRWAAQKKSAKKS